MNENVRSVVNFNRQQGIILSGDVTRAKVFPPVLVVVVRTRLRSPAIVVMLRYPDWSSRLPWLPAVVGGRLPPVHECLWRPAWRRTTTLPPYWRWTTPLPPYWSWAKALPPYRRWREGCVIVFRGVVVPPSGTTIDLVRWKVPTSACLLVHRTWVELITLRTLRTLSTVFVTLVAALRP